MTFLPEKAGTFARHLSTPLISKTRTTSAKNSQLVIYKKLASFLLVVIIRLVVASENLIDNRICLFPSLICQN